MKGPVFYIVYKEMFNVAAWIGLTCWTSGFHVLSSFRTTRKTVQPNTRTQGIIHCSFARSIIVLITSIKLVIAA